MYIPLNDFYYEIGLDNIDLGELMGWNVDKGPIELNFSSQIAENGVPCLVIRWVIPPQYEFSGGC